MTSDQSQAAPSVTGLGYRPHAAPPKPATPRPASKARELWGIGEDGLSIDKQADKQDHGHRSHTGMGGDVTAAAWLIGHGAYVAEWDHDPGKERARLSRLRLYSYCMTLSACVLALMAFMYLLTGTADGDPTFTSLGVMFFGMMILMLWGALRVTRAAEES